MKNMLAISSIIFTLTILSLPIVWSDNDFEWGERDKYWKKSTAALTTENILYKEECGSCHMAYPAGLLPASSWKKILAGLDDHFGDNAELDADTIDDIQAFLLTASDASSGYSRLRKFANSIRGSETPIRITGISYFKHEHNEIPSRMVKHNPQVKSFSQCNACHARAEQGSFNEHDIRISGYGAWDD